MKAAHPTTAVMVAAAIAALKDKKGSSRPAIKKYIAANYKVDIVKLGPHLKKALKTGVDKKTLIAVKGSFKLAKVEKVKKVKKLKVSTRKQYPGVSDVQLGSPRPSACGTHVVCQLTANVHGYGSCVEDVYYEQPPAEGESDKETKMRVDRHRRREQVALERLSYGHMRTTYSKPRGHHGYGLYSSKGRRKTK